MKKFTWIKKFHELRKEDNWNSVSDIIPNEFDNYFLIHWNIGIIDNLPFDTYPNKVNETIEDINRRINIDKKFNLFLNPEEDKLFRQTNLMEIANMFNKSYDFKLLNKIKETPAIKILYEVSVNNLRQSIKVITKEEKLNLFIQDAYRSYEDKLEQELENISVEDYIEWQKDFRFDYCTYLFPNNRKWCITTSEDLPMLLCTKKDTNEQIVSKFEMELFKIKYDEKFDD